jgi:alpha-tubulin suppressor-like RCC1 family protein
MVIGSGAVGLDLGDNHACAVMSGGALRCWGRNAEGQIADPDSGEVLAPALVPDLGAPITAAATGARFSCFVVGTTVACRGSNDSAELGVGPADPVSTPHPVPQTLAIGCP